MGNRFSEAARCCSARCSPLRPSQARWPVSRPCTLSGSGWSMRAVEPDHVARRQRLQHADLDRRAAGPRASQRHARARRCRAPDRPARPRGGGLARGRAASGCGHPRRRAEQRDRAARRRRSSTIAAPEPRRQHASAGGCCARAPSRGSAGMQQAAGEVVQRRDGHVVDQRTCARSAPSSPSASRRSSSGAERDRHAASRCVNPSQRVGSRRPSRVARAIDRVEAAHRAGRRRGSHAANHSPTCAAARCARARRAPTRSAA